MPPTISVFPNHPHRRRQHHHHHHNHLTHLPPVLLSAFCLLVGAGGIAFALFPLLLPKAVPTFRCGRVEDTFRSSNNRRLGGDGISDRPKLLGFVGIQTGFSSRDRRDALRGTWFPSDADELVRLEQATGLAFRFVIGRAKEANKMEELEKEIDKYNDFMLIDVEEEYLKLPYKTLAYFKAAFELFDADYYVKADDDIYLRPENREELRKNGRLSQRLTDLIKFCIKNKGQSKKQSLLKTISDRLATLLAKERAHPLTYIGCMKRGPVFTDPKFKWYEKSGHLIGKEYFLHAYGPIYVLSAEVVASIAIARNNSMRMFSNEDVTIGSWMLAMNVHHEDNRAICDPRCTHTSIAVWDIPKCSGLCNPAVRMKELHNISMCSKSPTLPPDDR